MNINSWNNEFILGWLVKSRRHKSYEINNNSDGIVSVTYYKDYKKATETLKFD